MATCFVAGASDSERAFLNSIGAKISATEAGLACDRGRLLVPTVQTPDFVGEQSRREDRGARLQIGEIMSFVKCFPLVSFPLVSERGAPGLVRGTRSLLWRSLLIVGLQVITAGVYFHVCIAWRGPPMAVCQFATETISQ